MKLIDITRPLFTGMPHWPGDRDTDFDFTARIDQGSSGNVGHLSLSVHNGTHVDAPYHYDDAGQSIAEIDPAVYVGPCLVVDARGRETFTTELFAGLDLTPTPRVLFRTDTWIDGQQFPQTWPLLDPELPAWLAERGVQLVGMDVPSVDPLTSKTMANHHRLKAAQILIMESLDLRDVVPGIYELIALPLKIRGADGSPVRAVLRS